MWNRLPSEFRQLAPSSSTSPLAISQTLTKTKHSSLAFFFTTLVFTWPRLHLDGYPQWCSACQIISSSTNPVHSDWMLTKTNIYLVQMGIKNYRNTDESLHWVHPIRPHLANHNKSSNHYSGPIKEGIVQFVQCVACLDLLTMELTYY